MEKEVVKNGNMRVVCIGGGTGLSAMLRGLKLYTQNITAIVTVADDGGGSGVLRSELGILPPGDIRNCLLSLANIEPSLKNLFAYRFDSGKLRGQSFGNLFLAAMYGISGSFEEAVTRMGEVLAITGKVLPVTTTDVNIRAEFSDGTVNVGESCAFADGIHKGRDLKTISLVPSGAKALPGVIDAINEADLIILGPGSLYTSIMPNLLVDGVAEAVAASKAVRMYVANIMTQNGETEGYTLSDHISELFSRSGGKLADICIANNKEIPAPLLEKYADDAAAAVIIDKAEVEKLGVTLYTAPLFGRDGDYVRHNPRLLAREIMKIFRENAPTQEYTAPKH